MRCSWRCPRFFLLHHQDALLDVKRVVSIFSGKRSFNLLVHLLIIGGNDSLFHSSITKWSRSIKLWQRWTSRKIIYGTEIAYLFDNLEKFELVSHYSSLMLRREDYGLKSSIIVKNYETNLLRKSNEILSKSHIVCLSRKSVSEARMDVFQTMAWWRRTITCCNILHLLHSAKGKNKENVFMAARKTKENKIYSAFWSRFLQDIAIPSTFSWFILPHLIVPSLLFFL